MASENSRTGNFEDSLLGELQGLLADGGYKQRKIKLRPFYLVAAFLIVAVAGGVVVPVLLSRRSPARAFAVRSSDDLVTASIYRFDDASGLESELRADGIRAIVNYLPAGYLCAPGSYTSASSEDASKALTIDLNPRNGSSFSVTASPSNLDGFTLVITASRLGSGLRKHDATPPANDPYGADLRLSAPGDARGAAAIVTSKNAGHCKKIKDHLSGP